MPVSSQPKEISMKEKLIQKIDDLINKCTELLKLAQGYETNRSIRDDGTSSAEFIAFKTATLSFFEHTIGNNEKYYKDFDYNVIHFRSHSLIVALELLKNIRKDVDEGWLENIKGIVSAELFSDFLEMAEHLLEENYKDPAAVIIGSVLEENLRELCVRNGIAITTTDPNNGTVRPHKAETMNIDLYKHGIYNGLVQKSVTAWLALRNNAAHGKYGEYDLPQVRNLLQSVRDFIIKYL